MSIRVGEDRVLVSARMVKDHFVDELGSSSLPIQGSRKEGDGFGRNIDRQFAASRYCQRPV